MLTLGRSSSALAWGVALVMGAALASLVTVVMTWWALHSGPVNRVGSGVEYIQDVFVSTGHLFGSNEASKMERMCYLLLTSLAKFSTADPKLHCFIPLTVARSGPPLYILKQS